MAEPIAEYGNEVGVCGSPDGTTWEKLLTVDGKLQIDTESAANPTNLDIAISALRDAIAGAEPDTSTLYALAGLLGLVSDRIGAIASPDTGTTNQRLGLLADRIGALVTPTEGSINARLALLLTELQQKLETADLGSDTTRYINAIQHGYTGSAWQKQGLIWAYYDTWAEDMGGTKSGAGVYMKTSSAIPAGFVYVLQAISILNNSGARGSIAIHSMGAIDYVTLAYMEAPPAFTPVFFTGEIALKAGDTLYIRQGGCLDGDVLLGGLRGYKMKLNM